MFKNFFLKRFLHLLLGHCADILLTRALDEIRRLTAGILCSRPSRYRLYHSTL